MDALSTVAAQLGTALLQHGLMLTLAESCTGGLASASITDIAGSSAWFDRGFITYSNEAKIEMLGVLAQTLKQFGAVSEQTACEMALGALKFSHADIAGSITGIAGPAGGSADKPVGTVSFACVVKNGNLLKFTKHFQGTRQQIRQQATITLLSALLAQLA